MVLSVGGTLISSVLFQNKKEKPYKGYHVADSYAVVEVKDGILAYWHNKDDNKLYFSNDFGIINTFDGFSKYDNLREVKFRVV